MPVHIAPNSTGCNLSCGYCYENDDREHRENWVRQEYDLDAIKARIDEYRRRYPREVPGLHGGEALLIPTEDLREIMEYVSEQYADVIGDDTVNEAISVQTNGTLIDDEHIDLFREFRVSVGISVDGPLELNEYRVPHGVDDHEKHTKRVLENIDRLVESGVGCGLIVVLHQANAGTDERFERLLEWQAEMEAKGVSGHWNPAIPYDGQEDLSLSPERLKECFLRGWEWLKEEPGRNWCPMRDYMDNLLGLGLTNCIENKCDPLNAGSAKIIAGDGETTGCGKTWGTAGDGPAFLQGSSTGNEYNDSTERYDALKKVPGPYTDDEDAPDMGGCRGCEYWNVCQGGCPGSAMHGDFRHRTRWCEAKYALYEAIERDLRIMFPNLTLITDYPWDAELAYNASRHNLDIAPFAPMDPQYDGRSSTFRKSATHPRGPLRDRVPEKVMKPADDFERRLERWKERYGEENVVGDPVTGDLHADSSMPQVTDWEEYVEEAERYSDEGSDDETEEDDQ